MNITAKDLENVPGTSKDTWETIVGRFLHPQTVDINSDCDVNYQYPQPRAHSVDSGCDNNCGSEVELECNPTKAIQNVIDISKCIPVLKLVRSGRTRTASRWIVSPTCSRCSRLISMHTQEPTTIPNRVHKPESILNRVITRKPLRRKKPKLAALCYYSSFDEQITQMNYIGKMNKKCSHCKALKFHGEIESMCCKKGAIKIPKFKTKRCPKEFLDLYSNKDFLKNIRAYNSIFAFTSVGATTTKKLNLDKDLANGKGGVYTFRVQGTMCHRMGSLLPPGDNAKPQFAQIYIMDPSIDARASRRCEIMEDLCPDTVKLIETVLSKKNPFAKVYNHVGLQMNTNPDVAGLRIYECPTTNLNRYNRPKVNEIAAVVIGELDTKQKDLIVYKKGGGLKRVFDTCAQSDPFQYPILFPRGQFGWKPNLKRAICTKHKQNISTREFYAFR